MFPKHLAFALALGCVVSSTAQSAEPPAKRLLYVAEPGIRDYVQFGGHGILVFDIDNGHRFVRRIASGGLTTEGKPMNVKGICASAATQRLYVSTLASLQCFDLQSDKLLSEITYEGGCDRPAITPDGKTLFTPSFEKNFWHVIDAASGKEVRRIPSELHAHNTIVSIDGAEAYLADRGSRFVQAVDTATGEVARKIGPFGDVVRPFTVNGKHTLGYMNVDSLLGFEIADLKSGIILHRVEVSGFGKGPVAKHGCPSHGVGLTPDEKEVWVTDSYNKRLHIFDNTVMPPKQIQSIELHDEPGWITFSIDGKTAYPASGEVIDVASRKILTNLKDEKGAEVQSEKLMEIDFDRTGKAIATGDQFGIGRVR